MEKYLFGNYIDFDENETLARIYLPDDDAPASVPLNVSIDGDSDMDLQAYDFCTAYFWTNDYKVTVYKSEEDFEKANPRFSTKSMIPMGTFGPAEDNENNQQNAMILFSGFVREVVKNPEPQEGSPRIMLRIESYAMSFDLYYFEDDEIKPGYILYGQAWLYAQLKRAEKEE